MEKLIKIQMELKAPKSQKNNFGNYNYRNCEDIIEAVKPLLLRENCRLIITDDIINIGDRYYVKATAKFSDGESEIIITAFAREPESKKGMDESQITGAASSYARKYALNGLFLIDDTKDADNFDNREQSQPIKQNSVKNPTTPKYPSPDKWLNVTKSKDGKDFTEEFINVMKKIKSGTHTISDIRKEYKVSKETEIKIKQYIK